MNECGGRVEEQVGDTSVAIGETIWIKLSGGCWWPAQIVDENSVSKNKISGKKSSGDVLVRLYGTYMYSYNNPIKSQLEFDAILKKNNGSHRQIFEKSLEKDMSLHKPRGLKGQGSKSKTNAKVGTSGGKSSGKRANSSTLTTKKKAIAGSSGKAKTRHDGEDMLKKRKSEHIETPGETTVKETPRKKSELNNGPSPEKTLLQKSEQRSGRRVKVMQNLGLAAPCGSPFFKN